MSVMESIKEVGRLYKEIGYLSRYEGGGGSWQWAFIGMIMGHQGQTRQGGELQQVHCARVGLRAAQYADAHSFSGGRFDALVAVSLLHDVIEDTEITRDVIAAQLNVEVGDAVQAVTHLGEEEPDEVYLSRVVAGGELAILAKRFDRLDNVVSLATVAPDFRAKKMAEVQAALPIWQRIDPDGAVEIEAELEKLRRAEECPACQRPLDEHIQCPSCPALWCPPGPGACNCGTWLTR